MSDLRQRLPRVRDKGFLAFVGKLPCCVCGAIGRTQAAHIRMGRKSIGKRETGGAERPDDRWSVPLCGPIIGAFPPVIGCHAVQHGMNEKAFWIRADIDPFVVAAYRFAQYEVRKAKDGGSTAPAPKSSPRPKRSLAAPSRKPRAKQKIAARKTPWPKGRKIRSKGFR